MENLDSDMPRESSSFMNNQIKAYLMETAKWGTFLSIMGFILIGLMVVMAIFVMTAGASLPSIPEFNISMGLFGIIYIIVAAIFFFPTYYLFLFSSKAKEGLRLQNEQALTAAFQNLKSVFKFWGIYTIILISLYVLIFVVAIIGAAMVG
jgi:hypothetical protein